MAKPYCKICNIKFINKEYNKRLLVYLITLFASQKKVLQFIYKGPTQGEVWFVFRNTCAVKREG